VILDQLELERDAAQQLQLALARCAVVVVSRERVLWGDASSLAIHGLEPQFAIGLIESEIGRRVEATEHEAARQICEAFAGHPLRIREAVAPVREEGRTLSEIAVSVAVANPRQALAAARLAAADADQRRLWATLALFGASAVGREHLKSLIDAPNADAIIDAAVADRDLRAHSPRYSLGLTAADAVGSLNLESAGDRALTHFIGWADATHQEPQAQLIEGRALLALLRWAVANGRLRQAIELGRAIDVAFAVGRRFDAWRELLELVRAAARESGDRAAEAWAPHQLGTRAVALGELVAGAELLGRALSVRRELGDRAGAAVTERNLAIARRLARPALWRNPFLLLLVGALVAAGAVVAVAAHHGGGTHGHATVTVTGPSPQHTVVHSSVALQIKATDSANRKLTCAAQGLPPGLAIHRLTGLISGRPNRTGSYEVTVGADDHNGASDKARFGWTVRPGVANKVSVTNPGSQSGTVKVPVNVQITASDSAGAALTYSASGLPVGVTIDSSTGLISGTPASPGSSPVTVTATDPSGASGSATFNWTINLPSGSTGTGPEDP